MSSDARVVRVAPDWELATVGRICDDGGGDVQTGPFGSQLHASDYVDDGIPSVMPQDLVDARISTAAIARIRSKDRDRLSRYTLLPGDVVYARRGDLRRRALAREEHRGWLCGTGCLRIRSGDASDERFLFYALGHPAVQDWIDRHAVGATMPNLNTDILRACPVPRPPVEDQRRIAAVLGALDNKIDSNRRLAGQLHEMAEALFRARYIDFVGVDDLESSLIGPIPRGWRVIAFSDAVKINPRIRIPRGEMRPFIEMAAVAPWATRPDRLAGRVAAGGCRYEPGDTLMARITGCIEHGKGAFLDFIDEAGTGSTEFFVLRAKPPLTPEAVFFLSRWEKLRAHAIANMTGSSGRQRVAVRCFDDFRLAVPRDETEISDVADFLAAAMRRALALWRESMTLTAIRDELLPKLVSGEIRVVPDADDDDDSTERAA